MDFKVKCKTIKRLEKHQQLIVGNLPGRGLGKKFLDLILKAQSTKRKADQLGPVRNKNFCSTGDPVKRVKT